MGISSLVSFNGSIGLMNLKGLALVWRMFDGSFNGMEEKLGPKGPSIEGRRSISHSRCGRKDRYEHKMDFARGRQSHRCRSGLACAVHRESKGWNRPRRRRRQGARLSLS